MSVGKKIMKRLRKARIFLNSLAFYMLIGILPLIIIVMQMNNSYFKTLESEVVRSNQLALTIASRQIEERIMQKYNIAMQVLNDNYMTGYRLANNPVYAVEVINQLRKYITGQTDLANIFLYNPYSDTLYSSTTSVMMEKFDMIYEFGEMGQDELRTWLSRTETQSLQPASVFKARWGFSQKVIPLLFSSKYQANDDGRIVLFLLDERSMRNKLGEYYNNIVVVNRKGEIVIAGQDADYMNTPEFAELAVSQERQWRFHNEEYRIAAWTSEDTGLTYLSLQPMAAAMRGVNRTRWNFMLTIVGLAVLLLVLTAIGMRVNYRPLRRLSGDASAWLEESDRDAGEYEVVKAALDTLSRQRERLREQYTNAQQALREHLLLRLLEDGFETQRAYNEQACEVGAQLTCTFFQVVLFQLASSITHEDRVQVLWDMKCCLEELEGHGAFLPNDCIAFIISLPDQDGLRPDMVEGMLACLTALGIRAWAGVSAAYPGIHQIPKSHMEALHAISGRTPRRSDIFYYECMLPKGVTETAAYPDSQLTGLEAAMIEGNIDEIDRITNEIAGYITSQDLPISLARCVGFDIINTLIKTMQLISRRFDRIGDRMPDVSALVNFQSVDQLVNQVQDYCIIICRIINQHQDSSADVLVQHIKAYIEENYCEFDFSSQSLTDNLGVSLTTIKKYYKQVTGQTPFDYANTLRMERAKSLLSQTDIPLRILIGQIGYADVSAFVRKFRDAEGITPGEYRKLHRSKAEQ